MTLPHLIRDWPAEWSELFEERAGIMEYVGGMSRKDAEREAEQDIRKIVDGPKQEGLELKF